MRNRHFLIVFLSMIAMLPALAFERPFPPNTKRGTMSPAPYPMIELDGKMRRLAPGGRIWNPDNLIEMPAALQGSGLAVNYTEDAQGDVDRVWILTRDEANRPLPNDK
jgi:hypothetical protein